MFWTLQTKWLHQHWCQFVSGDCGCSQLPKFVPALARAWQAHANQDRYRRHQRARRLSRAPLKRWTESCVWTPKPCPQLCWACEARGGSFLWGGVGHGPVCSLWGCGEPALVPCCRWWPQGQQPCENYVWTRAMPSSSTTKKCGRWCPRRARQAATSILQGTQSTEKAAIGVLRPLMTCLCKTHNVSSKQVRRAVGLATSRSLCWAHAAALVAPMIPNVRASPLRPVLQPLRYKQHRYTSDTARASKYLLLLFPVVDSSFSIWQREIWQIFDCWFPSERENVY